MAGAAQCARRPCGLMLKGVHWTTKRLANGTVVTHYYAWRGGPKLWGTPGSVEFIHSYEEAHRNRRKPHGTVLRAFSLSLCSPRLSRKGCASDAARLSEVHPIDRRCFRRLATRRARRPARDPRFSQVTRCNAKPAPSRLRVHGADADSVMGSQCRTYYLSSASAH